MAEIIKNLYCTGKYGLVDPYYRHVWLNIQEENIAHCIREIFWAKCPMIVFDLSQFNNYTITTIDSDVSLDWKIGPADYSSPLLSASLSNPTFKNTQTQYSCTILLNEPNHSRLPIERQKELQYQLMLYYYIIRMIYKDHNSFDAIVNDNKEWFDEFNKIFQTEICNNSFKEQLYQFAIKFSNTRYSFIILEFVGQGRQYE